MRLLWLKISAPAGEHPSEGVVDSAGAQNDSLPGDDRWNPEDGELSAATATPDEASTTRAFFARARIPPSRTMSARVRSQENSARTDLKPVPGGTLDVAASRR
jgi:hypothetical protein